MPIELHPKAPAKEGVKERGDGSGKKARSIAVRLGRLPVAIINQHLNLGLVAGDVVLFDHAEDHAYGKQPHREKICAPHLKDTVANPTHVGQKEKHKGKAFHLVRVVPYGPIVLLGIRLKALKSGVYVVKTTYPLSRKDLEQHLRKGICFEV